MRIGLGRLATLTSFRAHRTSKTVVKCKRARPATLSSLRWSDVRNCGKMLIFVCHGFRTSCGGFIHFFGGRRCSKTCILKFWMDADVAIRTFCFCWMNPLDSHFTSGWTSDEQEVTRGLRDDVEKGCATT